MRALDPFEGYQDRIKDLESQVSALRGACLLLKTYVAEFLEAYGGQAVEMEEHAMVAIANHLLATTGKEEA